MGSRWGGGARIDEVVACLGIEPLMEQDPFSLSGGQRALAAVAVLTAAGFPLLVLDQAVEWLDHRNRERVNSLLETTCAAGRGVLELASRLALSNRPSTWLGKGGIVDVPAALRALHPAPPRGGAALTVSDLEFSYPSAGFALGPVSVDVPAGACVGLEGPNGAGKTTLLRCIANLSRPTRGGVSALGAAGRWETPDGRRHHEWARVVRFVAQNPDDQLFLGTVREELGEGPDELGVVQNFGLSAHLGRSPFDLSRPHRRLLGIASGLIACPKLLLLDEPTAWLDSQQVIALGIALAGYCDRGGTVLFISHDEDFLSTMATATLRLTNGKAAYVTDKDGASTTERRA